MRRAIQREIEDVLSEKLLFGEFHSGDVILIDAEGEAPLGEFKFSTEARQDKGIDLPALTAGGGVDISDLPEIADL